MILVADLHLTDKPEDEYRWDIFDTLREIAFDETGSTIYILGDITDRRDRHSATLVNRLALELNALQEIGCEVVILMGNHDMPTNGIAFLEFLNLTGIRYLTQPELRGDLALFPWSANPKDDWREILAQKPKAVFMHQPVAGVIGENGLPLHIDDGLPLFPRGTKVYSGDIHTPQKVGPVVYVGAPHHKNFGDRHLCRLLILDDHTYAIKREVTLDPLDKLLLEVSSFEELANVKTTAGDQIKVRVNLPADRMASWSEEQRAIADWAKERGVRLSSTEALIDVAAVTHEVAPDVMGFDPKEIVESWFTDEGLDAPELLAFGKALMDDMT